MQRKYLKNTFFKIEGVKRFKRDEDEAYMIKMLEEALADPNPIYYTHEEFWKMVEEMEIEEYGYSIPV